MSAIGLVEPEVVVERRTSSALGSYQPALDGLRAVAMSVMLAYHGELQWAKGAFLGLSQFFTLSGFLITSILLKRRDRHGTVDLGSFWTQRYRRLMPAAMVTLFLIIIFGATVADPLQVKEIPGQVTAAALQVANWFFIYTDKSYINLFAAPSPVQHFWSLAVEEQFYIVMPLVFLALIRWTRRLRTIGAFFAIGAVASTLWMIWLYNHGASLDRLYYGTDTRAAELLMGGLLAVVLHRYPLNLGSLGKKVMVVVGFFAMAFMVWGWTHLELADGPVWRGGFMLISLVSCALIVSLLSGGPLTWLLSWGFLPAMGRITYGLYLYHWPLFLWLDEKNTGLDSWNLFFLRMIVTFAIAIASYNLMEMPIRNGFPGWLKGPIRWAVAPTAAAMIIVLAFVAGNREVDAELSPLATPVSDVAPTTGGGDGVLDVLIIPDERTAAVAEALRQEGEASDTLDVTVAAPFSCDGITTVDGKPICTNWVEAWPALITDIDPDIVLLYVNTWESSNIAVLSGLDVVADPAAVNAWTESVMSSGIDLLTARGAPVAWTQLPETLESSMQAIANPFTIVMKDLPKQNILVRQIPELEWDGEDVVSAAFVDASVDWILQGLELYRRTDAGQVPKVMVVGDSAARTLGYGLERWAADTGEAVVWTTATLGCGIADEGVVVDAFTRADEAPVSEPCLHIREGWKEQIAQFDPDVVIVFSTIWDQQDRRLPGWDAMEQPGDPAFDDYLLREYRESVDILSASGAKIVWVKGPCARSFDITGKNPGTSTGAFDTARAKHIGDVTLEQLTEERPDVALFDLFPVLCPNGEFVEDLDGVTVRPDGVHFSAEGSKWVADRVGEPLLELGLS